MTLLTTIAVSSFAQGENNSPIISIIPKPVKLEIQHGQFQFSPETKIWLSESTSEMQKLGDLISENINRSTGWKIFASAKMTRMIPQSLVLLQIKKDSEPNEGYKLDITPKQITITASDGAGIFYAIQSMFQLMPIDANENNLSVPCAVIEDYPRFKWRGAHLDCCRHMFPVEFIKKYIDILSMYKLNTFHWHLTEDQGWRIEIKKYPKLTEIGSWRKESAGDGIPYGGYYTQDQIRDIVAYARDRYITIVPEIEMPGHSLSALAAYPELSCTGGPFETETTWGVFDDIYCAGNDKVFEFLENVLTEVMDLFPGMYIHVGGDEAPKARWHNCPKCQARIKELGLQNEQQLQSYFIQRIEKFINSKGRSIIGWDEILEGGLAPNAAVMSWRGIDGGIAAAKSKHVAVMTPTDYCYFDYYQGSDTSKEPKAIGGFTPLEKVYSYNPVPDSLSADEAKYIIGVQANLWSEYIDSPQKAEYMILPRLCALSEDAWTPNDLKNFSDFSKRLEKHFQILTKEKINFRHP